MALSTPKITPNLVKTALATIALTAALGLLPSSAQASDDPWYDAFKDIVAKICEVTPDANTVPMCKPFGYWD